MIAAAGSAALALLVAQPAHALECEPGETLVQESGWRGQHLTQPRLVALPGRALVWWQSDIVKGAVVDAGVVTAQPALGPLPDLRETMVASTPAVTLVVGHNPLGGIIAQRLTADGTLLGEPHYLAHGPYYSTVSAASDGTRFLVAWTESVGGTGQYRVRAATMSPDGVVSAARDLAYTRRGIGLHAVRTGDVTWVIWSGSPTGENDGIFGVRLDGAGAPLDERPLHLSADSHVVAATSIGDHALLGVNGFGPRNLVPLDADGIAGAAVDVQDLVGDRGFVALTARPGSDGYLLWTIPSPHISGSFPAAPAELRAHGVGRDGTLVGSAPFAVVTGTDPSVVYDGAALRYAVGEDSGADGITRIRTGSITASGSLDADTVLDEERLVFETWEYCSPPPPPPDPYDGCSASGTAAGASTAGIVLLAALAMIIPRRRARAQ